MELRTLRDDVYRRPLATALERLGIGPGWTCVDVGRRRRRRVGRARRDGRPRRTGLRVDSDPRARDEVAAAAAAHSQVLAITQAGEDLRLPEPVDLAFCRFLLLHVVDPAVVLDPDGRARSVRAGGWSPRSRSPRRAGSAARRSRMPDARHPDVGALLPSLARDAGLDIVDAWAEAPAGVGPGTGRRLPEGGSPRSIPGDDPVVLPPLVTVVGPGPIGGPALGNLGSR